MRIVKSYNSCFVIVSVLCLMMMMNSVCAWRTQSWMHDLADTIYNRSLTDLTLPGTHDSCSWNLTDTIIEEPNLVPELVKVADWMKLPVGKIIDAWSQAHTVNLYNQFNLGVRYVDIRAACYNGEWYTHHGGVLSKTKMVELLDQIQRFMTEQPGEVIVLEITHFWSSSTDADAVKNEKRQLLGLIEGHIGNILYPRSDFTKTIGEMVETNRRVVVVLDDSIFGESSNIWTGSAIKNSYANSPKLSKMESYNDDRVNEFLNFNNDQVLFKMSWTLTPDSGTILDSILPFYYKNLLTLADSANKDMSNWAKTHNLQYPVFGNVFITDDISKSDIVRIVLETGLGAPGLTLSLLSNEFTEYF